MSTHAGNNAAMRSGAQIDPLVAKVALAYCGHYGLGTFECGDNRGFVKAIGLTLNDPWIIKQNLLGAACQGQYSMTCGEIGAR